MVQIIIDQPGPTAAANTTASNAAIQVPTYGTKRSKPVSTPNSNAPGTPMIASPIEMTMPTPMLMPSCARK